MGQKGAKARPLIMALVLAASCSPVPEEITPSWLNLDPLRGEVFVEFDGSWDRTEDTSGSRELGFEEGIRIRQSGNIFDPRIAALDLEVEPTFEQNLFKQSGEKDTTDSLVLDYSGVLNVLNGTLSPVGFTAEASRSTGDIDGFLGSRSEFDTQTRGGTIRWRNVAFPMSLRYSERLQEQTFRSGAGDRVVTQRDDILRSLVLKGRSSKMDVLAQRDWLDDKIDTRDADSTTDLARLNHRLEWGKGSRLNTRLDYFDRRKFNPSERFTAEERVQIQHTDTLFSTAAYHFQNLEQDTRTRVHNGDLGLTHQLYDNLTTNLNFETEFRDSENVDQEFYKGGLNLNYRKNILWDGTLNLGAGGSYRLTDRAAVGGLERVVDENQVIDSAGRTLLNQRFIETDTILVTAPACPASGCTLGSDYTVASVGDDLTEIRIVFGGLINVGDTILVSYQFEPLPSAKFSTKNLSLSAGLDFGWISVFHRESITESDPISGAGATFLNDRRESTTGLELTWDGVDAKASLTAERRLLKLDDFESDSFNFRETGVIRLTPAVSLNLTASQIFSESEGTDTDLFTTDVTLAWRPYRSLFVGPRLGAFSRTERGDNVSNGERTERSLTGGLDVEWQFRNVEISLRYDHRSRRGDLTESDEDRVILRVSRGF